MKKLQIALVFGIVSIFSAPVAYASASLSLVGVGNLLMPTGTYGSGTSNLTGLSGKLTYGGGALIDVPLGSRLSLEIGGFYYNRKFDTDLGWLTSGLGAGTLGTVNYNVIEAPVTFRFWLSRMIFLNLGGYVSSVMNAPTVTVAGTDTATSGIGSLGQHGLNYGLVGGLGVNLPLTHMVLLRLEGRYEAQLSNAFTDAVVAANSAASFKYNQAQFLAGLTFGGEMMK